MTKHLRRLLLASLVVAAAGATGCIITSAQILAHFSLPNPFAINAADPWERVDVDLAADPPSGAGSDYTDNKDKLQGLTDIAVLGEFVNTGAAGAVTVWITGENTAYSDLASIQSSAHKLWGPMNVAANSTVVIDWDKSAALIDPDGKKVLINEALNDGKFTLYTTGTASGTHVITVKDGEVVLTLDAGM